MILMYRRQVLKYKNDIIPLLRRLRDHTFSKRGFSWSGKLLSSLLLTLTHTYPLEDKFVNPKEWNSEGLLNVQAWFFKPHLLTYAVEFRVNHHQHWGKLYTAEEVEVSWHVPTQEEIDFGLQIFKELVEPLMDRLEGLLKPGKSLCGDATLSIPLQ